MRHTLAYRWLPALVLLGLVTGPGCGRPPEDAFRGLAAAARAGDPEGLLAGLTKRSRVFVRGVLAAAPEARPLLAPAALPGDVTVIEVTVGDAGDRADLLVRGTAGGPPVPVVMLREDGEWRVDLVECQRLWGRVGLGDRTLRLELP
jgi:hypothetical protein